MPAEMLTGKDVLKLLRERAKAAGGEREVARQLGLSQTYFNEVLKGSRGLGPKILRRLHYRKVTMYQPIEPKTA